MPAEKITIKFEGIGNKPLTRAINELAKAQARLERGTVRVGKATNEYSSKVQLLGGTISTLRSKMLVLSFALTILSKAFLAQVKAAAAQEKVLKQLDSILRSTGHAANLTSIQLDSMAKGLASLTSFSDEAIHGVERLLLTFTNIKDDVFPDALALTLDMAEAFGTDARSAAIQLGKALNDPVKGFTALKRIGVSFTAEQQKMIKNFARQGDVVSAQKVILEELNIEFGGVARNAGSISTRLALLSESWGDFTERLGVSLEPILMPVLGFVTKLLDQTKSDAENLITVLGTMEQTPLVKESQLELLRQQASLIENTDNAVDFFALNTMEDWQTATEDVRKKIEGLNNSIKAHQNVIGEDTLEVVKHASSLGIDIDALRDLVLANDESTQANKNRHGAITVAKAAEMQQKLQDLGITDELKIKILQLNEADLLAIQFLMDKKIALTDVSNKLIEMAVLLGFLEKNTATTTNSFKEMADQAVNTAGAITSAYSKMTSAQSENLNARMKNDMDSLKKSEAYEFASAERKKKMEEGVQKKFRAERKKIWKQQRQAKLSQALIDGYGAVTKTFNQFGWPWGVIPAGIVAGLVASQVSAIASTPMPKFAQGGLVGGRLHSQGGTMIEAEQGEFVMSRNAVDAIGTENLNRMNRGGGGAVNVTFTGNVMSQDFIENEAIPQIKEAIRRGADIGVA